MSRPLPRSRRCLALVFSLTGVFAIVLVAVTALAPWQREEKAQPVAAFVGPRETYLALGDSLAYGFQPNFDIAHGYAEKLYETLHERGTTRLITMACPGETTTSMMTGECRAGALSKARYPGSQLDSAVEFIRLNPGTISPVTLTIGANDVLGNIGVGCAEDRAGFDKALNQAADNLDTIVRRLSDALNGRGDLVLTTYYNPYGQTCPNTNPYLTRLNDRIRSVAARYGARLVDISPPFAGRLCDLTWICSSYRDIHATTAGYEVIAGQLLQAGIAGTETARSGLVFPTAPTTTPGR